MLCFYHFYHRFNIFEYSSKRLATKMVDQVASVHCIRRVYYAIYKLTCPKLNGPKQFATTMTNLFYIVLSHRYVDTFILISPYKKPLELKKTAVLHLFRICFLKSESLKTLNIIHASHANDARFSSYSFTK